jgi:hypothetical protein
MTDPNTPFAYTGESVMLGPLLPWMPFGAGRPLVPPAIPAGPKAITCTLLYPVHLFPPLSPFTIENIFILIVELKEKFESFLPPTSTWEPVIPQRYGLRRPQGEINTFPSTNLLSLSPQELTEVILEYNRFIQDGINPDGRICGFQKTFHSGSLFRVCFPSQCFISSTKLLS